MAVVGDATGAALGGNLGISFIPSKVQTSPPLLPPSPYVVICTPPT